MLRLPEAWVWDFWLVDDGERYHLFFLYASRALHDPDARHHRASVGHAISDDLTTWDQGARCPRPIRPARLRRPRHLDRIGRPPPRRHLVHVLHRGHPDTGRERADHRLRHLHRPDHLAQESHRPGLDRRPALVRKARPTGSGTTKPSATPG